ncbi:UNVERIFIED_CONTAM: hypothetical protein FKN15_045104 [Acipenser sinensis]
MIEVVNTGLEVMEWSCSVGSNLFVHIVESCINQLRGDEVNEGLHVLENVVLKLKDGICSAALRWRGGDNHDWRGGAAAACSGTGRASLQKSTCEKEATWRLDAALRYHKLKPLHRPFWQTLTKHRHKESFSTNGLSTAARVSLQSDVLQKMDQPARYQV